MSFSVGEVETFDCRRMLTYSTTKVAGNHRLLKQKMVFAIFCLLFLFFVLDPFSKLAFWASAIYGFLTYFCRGPCKPWGRCFCFPGGKRIGRLCSTEGIGGMGIRSYFFAVVSHPHLGYPGEPVICVTWCFTFFSVMVTEIWWTTWGFLKLRLANERQSLLVTNTPGQTAVFPFSDARESRKTMCWECCFNLFNGDTLPPQNNGSVKYDPIVVWEGPLQEETCTWIAGGFFWETPLYRVSESFSTHSMKAKPS